MSDESCVLTTRDFLRLEAIRASCHGPDHPLLPLLKQKLDAARVVFHVDIPADVATLYSCITYRVNGRTHAMRVLTTDEFAAPMGLFLPVTTPRGLGLIGLAEGQVYDLRGRSGSVEQLVLEKVHHQPEVAVPGRVGSGNVERRGSGVDRRERPRLRFA